MGCSTSKLQPEDQLDVAAPSSKPAGHRRGGFASDLFGRARKNHHNGGKSSCGSGDAAVAGRQHEEEQPRKGKKGGGGRREVHARSPGSPSFRYYCENAAAAAYEGAAVATPCHRGQAPTAKI